MGFCNLMYAEEGLSSQCDATGAAVQKVHLAGNTSQKKKVRPVIYTMQVQQRMKWLLFPNMQPFSMLMYLG